MSPTGFFYALSTKQKRRSPISWEEKRSSRLNQQKSERAHVNEGDRSLIIRNIRASAEAAIDACIYGHYLREYWLSSQ
jgi:hypothetical protein